jgi:hypothetical protein
VNKAVKFASIAVLCFAPLAGAQDQTLGRAITFPGSAWTDIGNYSPSESTVLFDSYAEQGATIYRAHSLSLTPYASLALDFDTKGYDWENRAQGQIGIKLTRNFRNGIVSVGTAYAIEDRFKSETVKQAAIGFANYWFGWGAGRRFPGSSWGIVGNISPVEHGNLVATAYLEQGVVVARFHDNKTRLVPFGQTTISGDTQGYSWENRNTSGGGFKVVRLVRHGDVEAGGLYLQETRFLQGPNKGGFNFFVKAWVGWSDLRHR